MLERLANCFLEVLEGSLVFRGINDISSNKCLAGVKTQIKKLVICDFAFRGVLEQLVNCFLEALGKYWFKQVCLNKDASEGRD